MPIQYTECITDKSYKRARRPISTFGREISLLIQMVVELVTKWLSWVEEAMFWFE